MLINMARKESDNVRLRSWTIQHNQDGAGVCNGDDHFGFGTGHGKANGADGGRGYGLGADHNRQNGHGDGYGAS